MKVAMYYNNHDVRVQEMPKPKIGPKEFLLKIIASGICGSDVMEWYRLKKAPLVLGHEVTGQIVEVGKEVKKFKKGDRVFVSHHVPCNTCRYCLNGEHTVCETLHTTNFYPGGFAEYIRIPEINVDRGTFLLPEEVSFLEGTFIEPLACVARGQRLAGLRSGQRVLILGSGISGLLHLLLAKARKAEKIITTDISDYRLKSAQTLGADAVIQAKEDVVAVLNRINKGDLFDLVIICTSAISAFKQALQCVDRGGTVLYFAPTEPGVNLSIPVNDFWRNGIKIMPSYGNSPQDAVVAIELIRSKAVRVSKLITHKLPLSEIASGFSLVANSQDSLKVIIEPHAH
ncbi:MAG: zinc-dependent dehydrogenase [Omnitrophica bacterium]|nr:zinc-dependent dehydrogenase [Candidatus Omnitrophota bacterium]